MHVHDAVSTRRSIKQFTDREITRDEIERLLEAAVRAPNHRMTEPWRFYVLGPESRAAYGRALGARKAKRVDNPQDAAAVVDKVARRHEELPALVAVATVLDDDPEIREEDYAAAFMGIQNLSLAAHAMGLGTHIKTGGVMADPAARAAVDLPDDQRIVALVEIGEPAAMPDPKERRPAGELTEWRS